MANSARRNILRRSAKRQLREIDRDDRCAWVRWWNQRLASKQSQLQEPPSSQLVPNAMLVNPDCEQLFAVVDTCSMIRHRCELMNYVVRLRELFPVGASPIKLIVSLTVLEELDKCNRRPVAAKRKPIKPSGDGFMGQPPQDFSKEAKQRADQPPRSFMRFIEEEMRAKEVLVSELDPFKKASLGERGQFEIINKDDRILECCIRAHNFIQTQRHHPNTKVMLVTEDNLFKSKATTFGVPSYRWLEFEAKFKNFGFKHYVSTPQLRPARFVAPARPQPESAQRSWYLTSPATPIHQHMDTPLTSTPHASLNETTSTSSDTNTSRPKLGTIKHQFRLDAAKQRMSNILQKISDRQAIPLPAPPSPHHDTEVKQEKTAAADESVMIVKEIINIK